MEEELMHQLAPGYALDALTPDEERAFEAHLARCSRCQEEVAGLSEVAASLAFAAPAAEPSPELRRRILVAARAERARVAPLRPRWAYPALAAAAVAACAAVWAATLHSQLGTATPTALHALPLHGAAGSVLLAANREATLVVSGLPQASAGKTYEAWVMQGSGAQPAGLFSGANTTTVLRLTRAVPAGARVGVTLEPAGGSPQPTSAPLVTSARA